MIYAGAAIILVSAGALPFLLGCHAGRITIISTLSANDKNAIACAGARLML